VYDFDTMVVEWERENKDKKSILMKRNDEEIIIS
jgi:hypothetical protein